MSQQQSQKSHQLTSEEKQPKQPQWLIVIIVTAIVGGVINIGVNHADAIAMAISTGLIHINWLNIVSFVRTGIYELIMTTVATISLFFVYWRFTHPFHCTCGYQTIFARRMFRHFGLSKDKEEVSP